MLDGTLALAELSVFELVERHAPEQQGLLRTLGYLHLREGRRDAACTASFDPIIGALRATRREADARVLIALVGRIRDAS